MDNKQETVEQAAERLGVGIRDFAGRLHVNVRTAIRKLMELEAQATKLQAERDEAVEALRLHYRCYPGSHTGQNCKSYTALEVRARDRARSVLAKHQGGGDGH